MKKHLLLAIAYILFPSLLVARERQENKEVRVRAQIVEYWLDGALASGPDVFSSWDVVHLRIEKPIERKGKILSVLIPSEESNGYRALWNNPGRLIEFRIDKECLDAEDLKIDLENLDKAKLLRDCRRED